MSAQEILETGMIAIPGGEFVMGSDRFYPEEAPAHKVKVDDFLIDSAPVTNREFAKFVAATGYVTVAELPSDPEHYPDIDEGDALPASLVFTKTRGPVSLDDYQQWWRWEAGACWRRPYGPDSGLEGLDDHPVVHIAYADAQAYADWAGKMLPTEAEWEYAARGGLDNHDYAWGDALEPDGVQLANYWRGIFPFANQRADGGYRTTAVGHYPPNGYGLYDMIGNVWEWTQDWYGDTRPKGKSFTVKSGKKADCCAIDNPRGGNERSSRDPAMPKLKIGRKVLKGGSHLCAENYCRRYRPAARLPQMIDSTASHIGFRCVLRTSAKS